MNLDYDLARLGEVLERNPNLYADFLRVTPRRGRSRASPRSSTPKHSDRLVYGTDMGVDKSMYRVTFRILESLDEHFYENEQFGYHWALNGFGLNDAILHQVYRDNAAKLLASRRA